MRTLLAFVVAFGLLSGQAFAQEPKEKLKEDTVPKSGSAGGKMESDQNAKQEGSSKIPGLEPNTPILVNGRLTVPEAPDGDTVPSKHSARTLADDQLPIAAYATRHLTKDQLQAIRGALVPTKPTQAGSRALSGYGEIGAIIPSAVALNSLMPFPADLGERIPSLKTNVYFIAEDKVLLINPRTRVVIGLIE